MPLGLGAFYLERPEWGPLPPATKKSTTPTAAQESEEMSSDQTIDRKVITPAEREARKVFRAADAKKALSDHEKAQKAFHENRERLKAERLARDSISSRSFRNDI
jgi:hypothetical protein